jgi:hypothetical protein
MLTAIGYLHVASADVIAARLDVDDHATEALLNAGHGLRRHLAASVPHAALPRLVRTLETVLVKVGLCASGQVVSPCGLKSTAGLIEAFGNAMGAEAAMRQRKEPAVPTPLLDTLRHSRAFADPSHLHIAIEDLPAFRSAARSWAMPALTRRREKDRQQRARKPLQIAA